MTNFPCLKSYPRIQDAIELIALDNGVINRLEPRDDAFGRVLAVLDKNDDLVLIEQYLASLDEDDFEELCTGESAPPAETETNRVTNKTHNFLNFVFSAL